MILTRAKSVLFNIGAADSGVRRFKVQDVRVPLLLSSRRREAAAAEPKADRSISQTVTAMYVSTYGLRPISLRYSRTSLLLSWPHLI